GLHRTKPINFANVSTDIVGIGTKVTLAELEDSKQLEITILGPYDIDLEKGIISYLAPIAKELLGKKVGDVVTIKSDEQKTKKYRIVNIERAG
ncbi:MAG: GreA/GreB family elongation factor, partial [candidate division WOR-3 bacterium]